MIPQTLQDLWTLYNMDWDKITNIAWFVFFISAGARVFLHFFDFFGGAIKTSLYGIILLSFLIYVGWSDTPTDPSFIIRTIYLVFALLGWLVSSVFCPQKK